MRILAVRGCNLTSFAGEFELDFEAEPIRGAGIFAIVGPTGAGKTTILDAICLALYDCLPRMDGADGSAEVGRADAGETGRIGYDDVRGILRHGAGSGFAEVDFVGQDGLNYRSRWSVNRARGRADGKLQWQKITLTCLSTGNLLGDKKRETLEEIEQKVGLNFQQFRRAVMLAQGDFDTFIKAKPKDRAELLERITGTEIYSTLSRAAFARAKASRETVAAFDDRMKLFPCMEPEVREAAERKLADSEATAAAAERERAAYLEMSAWQGERQRLEALSGDATTALDAARATDAAAEPDRQALRRMRRALELRPEFEASTNAAAALTAAATELEQATAAVESARTTKTSADAALEAARTKLEHERQLHASTMADVVRADALDKRLQAASADLRNAEIAAGDATNTYSSAYEARAAAERRLEELLDQVQADEQWLSTRERLGQLAGCVDRVVKDLAQRTSLLGQIDDLAQAAQAHAARIDTASKQRAAVLEALAASRTREAELAAAIRQLEQEAARIDVAASEAAQQQLAALLERCAEGQRLVGEASAAASDRTAADAERRRLEQTITAAERSIADAEARLPLLTVRLEEAQRSAALSSAAADEAAERMRALLIDGDPCPVCGSLEHPVSAVDELLLRRLREDKERVFALDAEIDEIRASAAGARATASGARATLKDVTHRAAKAEHQLVLAQQAWVDCRTALTSGCAVQSIGAEVTETCSIEAGDVLKAISATATSQKAEIEEALRRIRQASREALARSRELGAIREAIDQHQQQAERHGSEAEQAARAAELAGAKRAEVDRSLEDLQARLSGDLTDVLDDWHQHADCADRCKTMVAQWRDRQLRLKNLSSQRTALEREVSSLRSGESVAKSASDAAVALLAERRKAAGSLTTERAMLLDGRATADVRSEADARLKAASDQSTAAEKAAATAASDLAGADARLMAAQNAHAQANAAAAAGRGALEAALEKAQILEAEVATAVAQGSELLAREQDRLDTLTARVRDEEVRVAERRTVLGAHDARRPEAMREDLDAAISAAEAALASARREVENAKLAIASDDQARQKSAAIAAERDAEIEKSKVWRQLDELIGSADGAKFRRFAQSLTLDQLVRLANHHLDELCPRYELQRVPGADLALQVIDHDMAAEVRGLHNLSGGERFLISLALALGLAGMSSGRGVKVESLFIDEGFGSLDGASLATAIAVLEQLHATGRRVGVISHVEELKERIAVKVEVAPAAQGSSKLQIYAA
jgi:exonuclease SbcC